MCNAETVALDLMTDNNATVIYKVIRTDSFSQLLILF